MVVKICFIKLHHEIFILSSVNACISYYKVFRISHLLLIRKVRLDISCWIRISHVFCTHIGISFSLKKSRESLVGNRLGCIIMWISYLIIHRRQTLEGIRGTHRPFTEGLPVFINNLISATLLVPNEVQGLVDSVLILKSCKMVNLAFDSTHFDPAWVSWPLGRHLAFRDIYHKNILTYLLIF